MAIATSRNPLREEVKYTPMLSRSCIVFPLMLAVKEVGTVASAKVKPGNHTP